jgi:hypothetical protein
LLCLFPANTSTESCSHSSPADAAAVELRAAFKNRQPVKHNLIIPLQAETWYSISASQMA